MPRDFDYRILDHVADRPWPMPDGPWIMTQTWHDLLFAHWPVDRSLVTSLIPSDLDLDLYEGQAWLGVVPFHMTNVAPRSMPALPGVSAFPELNVRTYVRAGTKAGVYFFSLDAASRLAVVLARMLFHLPYYTASMRVGRRGDTVHYTSRRATRGIGHAVFAATYRPTGPVFQARRGSLEHFLVERYCLYTVNRRAQPIIVEIHHPPWPLQSAEAEIRSNGMVDAAGIRLPPLAPLLHYVKRQDVVTWRPRRVGLPLDE